MSLKILNHGHSNVISCLFLFIVFTRGDQNKMLFPRRYNRCFSLRFSVVLFDTQWISRGRNASLSITKTCPCSMKKFLKVEKMIILDVKM